MKKRFIILLFLALSFFTVYRASLVYPLTICRISIVPLVMTGCNGTSPWFYKGLADPQFQLQPCLSAPNCSSGSPWLNGQYSCPTAGQVDINWASPYDGQKGVVYGDANSGSCGLVGWHADYQGSAMGNMGCTGGFPEAPGLAVPLSDPSLGVYAVGKVTAMSTQQYADVYLDMCFYWNTPVGPSNLQAMEFLVTFEDNGTPLSSTFGCSDYYAVTSTDYQYFHKVCSYTVGGAWQTWNYDNLWSYVSKARCDPNIIGTCQWNLPEEGYISGIDYGIESGNGGSISAELHSLNLLCCQSYAQQPFIGY